MSMTMSEIEALEASIIKTAYEALRAAQLHEHLGSMVSSAESCARDSERFFNDGNFELARQWAVRSLSYSVGVFSPIYQMHGVAGIDRFVK